MTTQPPLIPEPVAQPQVFAAEGQRRTRGLRAALAIGALLLGIWALALALGAFGGFGALPDLSLGGQGTNKAPAAEAPSTAAQATAAQAAAAAAAGDPNSPSHKKPATSTPAPSGNGQSAVAPHGKPAGSGTGTGSGKPIGTPDNGSTNAGGNGNGKANGLLK